MSRRPGFAVSPGSSLIAALCLGAFACSGNQTPPSSPSATPPGDSPPPATGPSPTTPETTAPTAKKLPPAISGGTLLVLRDGSAAIASDPDRDRVYVVDLHSRQLRGEVVLDSGA